MVVNVKKLHRSVHIEPQYAHPGDSGFDLTAATEGEIIIIPGDWATIPAGLAFELPHGYEMQIRPRSGLMSRYGVMGGFGTVDQGYRGEVHVVLYNYGRVPFVVKPGMKIAQGVIQKVERVGFRFVDDLLCSARGEKGFGSTGL